MCLEVGFTTKATLQGYQHTAVGTPALGKPSLSYKTSSPALAAPPRNQCKSTTNRQNGPCGHRLDRSAVNVAGTDIPSCIFCSISYPQEDLLFQAQPETLLKIKILFYPNSPNWSPGENSRHICTTPRQAIHVQRVTSLVT